ncbi:hypothetical protein V5O48_007845 [Marasmius crinis-equi]|uniref:HMG box domain-containing protein n=1 Tax=Marasmius crinis-equi TaxID=585013 RepID=A0ABR3FFI9_9AGAR
MPASRTRRRSSTLNPLQPTKPGLYGVPSIPHRLTFCENVTPGTYTSSLDSPSSLDGTDPAASLDIAETLFPPAEAPSQPSRRRQPPGKRRSQGYIPRPPNAFMLFRADFVRQKHVPGTIEANHGSLSRIIGNCWRSLPAQDKRVWEIRAKHAKELHKKEFPNYKFKPIHTKSKKKNPPEISIAADSNGSTTSKVKLTISTSASKSKSKMSAEQEEAAIQARNEYLTQLLLLGHKNESLAAEMARYDEQEKARRDAMFSQSPQSEGVEEVDDEWEEEEYSETTTLLGDSDSWGNKLQVPSSSHSSSSSTSPAPATPWAHPDPFSSNQQPVQQPQPAYASQQQQLGSYLNLRRSSSVPPMMGMTDYNMGYYQGAPFGGDGFQNFGANAGGEMRPTSPNSSGLPAHSTPSAAAGAFAYPQSRQSFSQGRFSFSQLENIAPTDTAAESFAQYGYYGQRMSISTEHRMLLGGRRASSAQGMRRSWGTCNSANQGWSWGVQGAFWVPPTTSTGPLQTDDSPLPEVDTSLFEPGFNLNSFSMSAPAPTQQSPSPDHTSHVVSPLDPVHAPVPVVAPQPTYRTAMPEPALEENAVVDMSQQQQAYAMAYPAMVPVDSVVYEDPNGNPQVDYHQQCHPDGSVVNPTFQHGTEYLGDVDGMHSGHQLDDGAFEAAVMEQHAMMMAATC